MSMEIKDYSIHLIGIGGTGANIIETFLKSPEIYDLLKRSGVKVSCLAIDVADHDIYSLQSTYDRFKEGLKAHGIASDKIQLTARSVKFPAPEVMFEFIENYPKFLEQEKARVPSDYKPWLSSSMEIPPLSGGDGRRRALSKAIYGLNYYYLRLIDGYLERFKEEVSSSTLTPIIFVIFGIGGGTGSGMAVDFVRHLRRKLGGGFPIIGLGILPCVGDDPPAKGSSAYASMIDLELLLNRSKNGFVKKMFGSVYENPYTAFIMMPLGPAFSNTGSLIDAKKIIDEAIVDILINSIRFDLSDLLNNIGASLDHGDRWIHTITTLKISYPINEHISLIKLQLNRLDKLRMLRKDKLEIYKGDAKTGLGGLERIINLCYNELAQVYKQWLIERGLYEESRFEEVINEFIYEDKSIEMNFSMQVKGVEDQIKSLMEEVTKPIQAVGLEAREGTPEARVRGLVQEVIEQTKEISKTRTIYHEFATRIIDDLRSSIASTQRLTVKQKLLLEDLIDVVALIDSYLKIFKRFMEVKSLADRLYKEISRLEKSEAHEAALNIIQGLQNPELVILFSLIPALIQPPKIELKMIDSHLSNMRIMRRILSDRLERMKIQRESVITRIKNLENEKQRLSQEISKSKLSIISFGKRKFLEDKIKDLDKQLILLKAELEDCESELNRTQMKLQEYVSIEKKFEVDSDYRKLLSEVSNLADEYYEKLSGISKDRGYYDRVAEITEEERLRIMQKILSEEEASLTRETILNEIIDKRHLKEYLVGTLRILRLPSALGLTNEFRTEYMWVTVVAPRGIWDQDLASELKTTLSGYILGDASRCITIREIGSKDPWTIRFLIIASKARMEELEVYNEMRSLYERASRTDRILSHSFLLEQGILASRDLDKIPIDELKLQKLLT
ncbi:MAG: tubulin-like doman-containing protein [Nitrososphaerales archaeon]